MSVLPKYTSGDKKKQPPFTVMFMSVTHTNRPESYELSLSGERKHQISYLEASVHSPDKTDAL